MSDCDPEIKKELGLVQVYTGDGKGKTTTCLGLAFRASGRGLNVIMIQFLKPDHSYGEQVAADMIPNFTILPMGVDHMHSGKVSKAEDVELTRQALLKAKEVLTSGEYDLVILDEINNTMDKKLCSVEKVLDVLEHRAPNTEVVLSGRAVPKEIVEYADLVTEMRKIKHPFDKGIRARKGIEY